MLYNQPFDQPGSPNASYVNGNPSTGTPGSIPPAAAFEYPQREIVSVISYAFTNGLKDFSGSTCLTPSNSDTSQLLKAIEGMINSYLIDTVVTFTVGATGTFANLIDAMEYLSKYRITQNGYVTLQLQAGVQNYSQMVYINHPNNDKISILGATMLAAMPTTDAGYTFTGTSGAALISDTAANLTLLRTKFATELHFTQGAGFQISGMQTNELDAILFTSDGSSGPVSDGQVFSFSGCCGETVSDGIHVAGIAVVGANYGFTVINGGSAIIQSPLVVLNSQVTNITINNYCIASFLANVVSGSCLGDGVGAYGYFDGLTTYLVRNVGVGAVAANGGYFSNSGGNIKNNAGGGLNAVRARGDVTATFSGNTGNSVVASDAAYVKINGSTGVSGSSNPAVGTLGNNNSLIFT